MVVLFSWVLPEPRRKTRLSALPNLRNNQASGYTQDLSIPLLTRGASLLPSPGNPRKRFLVPWKADDYEQPAFLGSFVGWAGPRSMKALF